MPRRIKAQQAAFQAAKKVTGNTHTAGGGIGYQINALVVTAGGLFLASRALVNLSYGSNKYSVPNE